MTDRLPCGHGVPMATLTGTICVACERERQTARADAAERERDALRIRAREVTCVWCGHQFVSTLQSQAQHLYDHAKTCEKHPLNAAERQLAELRAEVERLTAREAKLVEALQPFARIGEAWQATLQELLARHGAAIMGGNEEAYFHAARLLAEEHDHA